MVFQHYTRHVNRDIKSYFVRTNDRRYINSVQPTCHNTFTFARLHRRVVPHGQGVLHRRFSRTLNSARSHLTNKHRRLTSVNIRQVVLRYRRIRKCTLVSNDSFHATWRQRSSLPQDDRHVLPAKNHIVVNGHGAVRSRYSHFLRRHAQHSHAIKGGNVTIGIPAFDKQYHDTCTGRMSVMDYF